MRLIQQETMPAKVCAIKEICQSCRYVNEDYAGNLDAKFQIGMSLLTEAGVSLQGVSQVKPIASPKPLNYRCLAKLVVSKSTNPDEGKFTIGLYQPGSHNVIDISSCPIHVMTIKSFLYDLKGVLNESALEPFDESTMTGDIRYVTIRASHLKPDLQIVFVTNTDCKRDLLRILTTLRKKNHKLSSVHMQLNQDSGNAIFSGNSLTNLFGVGQLRENLCELTYLISPTSFFQINPWVAELIYRRIESLAGQDFKNQIAWDLYCGIGQISLVLARSGFQVYGIEENPLAIEDAKRNAQINELNTNAHFIAGRVEDVHRDIPEKALSPKVIVVNPSRRGLADSVRMLIAEKLRANPSLNVFYVSCSMETLSRDLKHLTDYGCRIRQIEAYDMFPQTKEMEWLAVITGVKT